MCLQAKCPGLSGTRFYICLFIYFLRNSLLNLDVTLGTDCVSLGWTVKV